MTTIDLSSNRSKGQNAYICPVVRYSGAKDMDRVKYPKPKAGQESNAHQRKYFEGEVDISDFSDGWYYYYEATFQGRGRDGLVEIKGGEVVDDLATIDELLVRTVEEYYPSLNPLLGTPKQVAWAETIRAKLLLSLWEEGYEQDIYGSLPAESKWWIESANPAELRKRIAAIHALEAAAQPN
jgi:hypothetical protein